MNIPAESTAKFSKGERIVSRRQIEMLFGGGNRSMAAYPVRMVYMSMSRASHDEAVQVLVTVSKRHFKHAVRRNRVKRQLREAYRANKHLLYDVLQHMPDRSLALAFIWQSDRLYDSTEVAFAMESLLRRLSERLIRQLHVQVVDEVRLAEEDGL